MTTETESTRAGNGDVTDSVGCRVLLVDNNPAFRRQVSAWLDSAGYSVVVATDGYEALASVVHDRPDVVLADIMMPRLDGYQMCALIKSNVDYQHIPVIMLSGNEGQFDKQRALLVGSDSHVSKPLDAKTLVTALMAACPERSMTRMQR